MNEWYDIPSEEMTLEQARSAVRELRKKVAEQFANMQNECRVKKWCPTYTINPCNCYSVEADDKSFIGMADCEFEDILTKSNEMLAISVFEVVRLLYDFTEYPEEVMIRLINSINNKAVIVYDWEKANYQDADMDDLVRWVKKLKKVREEIDQLYQQGVIRMEKGEEQQ